MKKKIIISVFLLLILITVIAFVVGAIESYNYDVKYHSDDKWVGFGVAIAILVGGFVVFYELDLFYTVYYFFVKQKTKAKSILNILCNLTLLTIIFTDSIAHFLYKHVSEIFAEEGIVSVALAFTYVILRFVYLIVANCTSDKAELKGGE